MPRFRHGRSSRYLRISPLHLEFQAPLPTSSSAVYQAISPLRGEISQSTYRAAYTRFKPSDSEQRLPLPYYRGCWHGISRGFFWARSTPGDISAHCFPNPKRSLQPKGLRPPRGVAPSGFRPVRNIRYCSHPWMSGQCLSPDVAVQPLSPATRRCLGEPLPHQLADRK